MAAIEKCRNHPSRTTHDLENDVKQKQLNFLSCRRNINVFTDGLFRSLTFGDEFEYPGDLKTEVKVKLIKDSLSEVTNISEVFH
jgi:hypothetical protein